MKLKAFAFEPNPPPLVPAPPDRAWMDQFTNGHAYKCLPLAIGNTYGWQVLCPHDVQVRWNGGMDVSDLVVDPPCRWVESNFSRGVVTFLTGYIFRTPPGYHMMASGPSNWAIDGIAPMTGVIETDWLPYPFTMNWWFKRPGAVVWRKGDPFCQVWLVAAHLQRDVEVDILNIASDPMLDQEHRAWAVKRAALRARMAQGEPAALRHPWDKDYFVGRSAAGAPAPAEHVSRLRCAVPVDRRAG